MKKLFTLFTLALLAIPIAWGATTATLTMSTSQTSPVKINGVTFSWTSSNIVTGTTNGSGFKSNSNMKVELPSGATLTTISKTNGSQWGSGATIVVYAGSDNTGTQIASIVTGTNSYPISSNNTGGVFYFANTTSKNAWINSLTITYEEGSAPETVAKPTFSLADGTYTEAKSVEISCETDGASIYYTTNGSDPTTSSTLYESAIAVNSSMTIKAKAFKEGMTASDIATANYIIDIPPAGTTLATFDATIDKGSSPLTKEDVTFICSSGDLNAGDSYRLYKNSTTTFSVPEGYKIVKIAFTGVSGNPVSGFGTTTGLTTSGDDGVWEGNAQSVSFTASVKQVRCSAIKIYYTVPVADGYYLVGDFSGSSWPALATYKFTSQGNGIYVLNTTIPDMNDDDYIHFKIAKIENGVQTLYSSNYENGYPVYKGHNTDIPMSSSDQEIYYMPDNYQAIFTLDINNMKFSVEKPQLFILGTFNGYAEPGVEMTKAANGSWTLAKQLDAGAEFRLFDGWHVHHGGNSYWIYQEEHESFGETRPSDLGLELDINNNNQSIFHMVDAGNYLLTVNSSLTKLVADLAPESYAINCTATPQGAGSVTSDKETACAGETVTLTVTPADNDYQVVSVTLNGEMIDPVNGVYSFTMPSGVANVVATFAKIDYEITVTYPNGNHGTISGLPTTANSGDQISFTVTPNNNKYEVLGVTATFNNGSIPSEFSYSNGTCSFRMPAAPVTITITYSRISTSNVYELVTDASTLKAGDKIIFTNGASGYVYAMGSQNGNYRPKTSTSSLVTENKVTAPDGTQVITLEGQAGAWYFNVGNGYLTSASSSSNYLRTTTTTDDNAKATISIANKVATITFQGSNTRKYIRYNNSQEWFSCYSSASSEQDVSIFRQTATGLKVDITPESGEVIGTQNVTIEANDDQATVSYKIGENGETVATNTYTTTVPVSGEVGSTVTVYGYATMVDDGETLTDENSATYTFVRPNAPTITPASCAIASETQSVTIDAGNYSNATIEYSTDGGTTWNTYNGAFNVVIEGVGQSVTVQARVTVNGVTSEVATATYTRGVQPVVFSPARGTYYGAQTCQMFSTSKGARIYYTTDGSDPVMNQGTTRLYTGEISMPPTATYQFKARAYIGTTGSEVTSANYNVRPRSEGTGYDNDYLLFSVAELNAVTFPSGSHQTNNSYTMVNPVQVVWMSTFRNNGYYPEYCLIRDNTGYGMLYFGYQNSSHAGDPIFKMGDWISGGYNGKVSLAWSSNHGQLDTHPEMGTSGSGKKIYNWSEDLYMKNDEVLPEYLTIPEILSSDPTDASKDYWGHYVHLRKTTVELTSKDEDDKWSGIITDENGAKINYYDKFYLQSKEEWTINDNFFTGHPNRTFDIYGFVACHIPSEIDYQISPFAFEWIDQPQCDHETGDYTSKQIVSLSSPEDPTATIWYKTSDMDDFHVYTEPITVNSTTNVEWYATKQSQYSDVLESKVGTITMTFVEIAKPVISPESIVKTVGETTDATIAYEEGKTIPDGAVIVYTTDGSDPKNSENVYTLGTTLTFSTTTTVRAITRIGNATDGYVYSAEADPKTYTFVKSNGVVYDLITNVNQLIEDGVYMIVSQNYGEALSIVQNEANRGAAGVMFVENTDKAKVYGNSDVALFQLSTPDHAAAGEFLFNTGSGQDDANGYLCVGSESDNTLLCEAEMDELGNDIINVTIDADGRAHLRLNYSGGTDRYIQYWNRDRYFTTYKTEDDDRAVYIYGTQATPLAVIEKSGTLYKGYTVADNLQVVWVNKDKNVAWARDLVDNINAVKIPTDTIDYMQYAGQQKGEWQQNNWVMLDFSGGQNALAQLAKLENNCVIEGGTLTGEYTDARNYTIKVSNDGELDLGESIGEYTPNVYCAANYGANEKGIQTGSNGNKYWFMTPKVMEVATHTWSVWNDNPAGFFVPAFNDTDFGQVINGAHLKGGYEADLTTYNVENFTPSQGQAYEYLGVVMLQPEETTTPASAPRRAQGDSHDIEDANLNGKYKVAALNLTGGEQIVTGVNQLQAGREVVSVTYCDVAGRMSQKPFQGLNIIVTRYTDGTTVTRKALF